MEYIVIRLSVIAQAFAARVQPFVPARRGHRLAPGHSERGSARLTPA
jgi:hypothetical protein